MLKWLGSLTLVEESYRPIVDTVVDAVKSEDTMSLELFTLPSADGTREGYRLVAYSQAATDIIPVSFLVVAIDDYVDLDCSY